MPLVQTAFSHGLSARRNDTRSWLRVCPAFVRAHLKSALFRFDFLECCSCQNLQPKVYRRPHTTLLGCSRSPTGRNDLSRARHQSKAVYSAVIGGSVCFLVLGSGSYTGSQKACNSLLQRQASSGRHNDVKSSLDSPFPAIRESSYK